MSSSDPQVPNIVLSRKARKMMVYAAQTHPNKEVMGFGRIRQDDEGDIWVTDIIIPPHEVTGSTVELTPEILSALWGEIVAAGGNVADYRVFWHSHASMNVFASGQDTETLRALAVEFGGTEQEDMVALGVVCNAKADFYGYYAAWVKTDIGMYVAEGKANILLEVEPEDKKLKKVVAQMMERVTEKKPEIQKYVPKVVSHDGHQGYFGFPNLMNHVSGLVTTDDNPIVAEMDEQEEAYYAMIRATYPVNHETHNMNNEQFAEWYENLITNAEATHSVGSGT